MKKRKICVVTGSRADYAHQYWLLKEIEEDRALSLQLVVTGMHLSRRHGLTHKVITKDGFAISARADISRYPNTPEGTATAVGAGCQKFAKIFAELNPDIVVLFGDRFEMLAAGIAAYMLKIPIAHIHGGETTEGAFDEAFRHSLTKMAAIHFPAAEPYRRRIIQLGEDPRRIFQYGSPGLEILQREKLLTREELARELEFDLTSPVAIVTFHPVTLGSASARQEVRVLLKALRQFDLRAILTKANSDPAGEIINEEMIKFCERQSERFRLYDSLGVKRYLSCLRHFDVMIGNSSSGLVEAPSFGLPVVNIGDRQKGRLRSANVIDVSCDPDGIAKAIRRALSGRFRTQARTAVNPYGNPGKAYTSVRIKNRLKGLLLGQHLIMKKFYDLAGLENGARGEESQ